MDAPIRREVIVREVIVEAPREDVWAAITTPELGAWFGADVDVEARPGGSVSFRFPDGSVRRGVVEAVEPPDRFAFRWRLVEIGDEGIVVGEGSTVEFRLSRTDEGSTRVVVTEYPARAGSPGPPGPLAPTELAVHA